MKSDLVSRGIQSFYRRGKGAKRYSVDEGEDTHTHIHTHTHTPARVVPQVRSPPDPEKVKVTVKRVER
jgi:hypothetical protein